MTVKKMQFEINVNWSKTRGGKLDQKIPDFPYKTLTSGSNLYFFFSNFLKLGMNYSFTLRNKMQGWPDGK